MAQYQNNDDTYHVLKCKEMRSAEWEMAPQWTGLSFKKCYEPDRRPKCHKCDKPGHLHRDCWTMHKIISSSWWIGVCADTLED